MSSLCMLKQKLRSYAVQSLILDLACQSVIIVRIGQ